MFKRLQALHYRHVSTSIARQLQDGRSVEDIILDRARGYTCSVQDPVTGGVHCALGGGPFDFYVTSTLASQCPPAIGRALGISLSQSLCDFPKFKKKSVSIVSLGDGSTNNAMFLATANLARYSQVRGFKCPILFVVTNNDICISLRGYGSLSSLVRSLGIPVYTADGSGHDINGLWENTKNSLEFVRKSSKPAILVVDKVPRRFGHAATDRQTMYLSKEEIEEQVNSDPLKSFCQQAVNSKLISQKELAQLWEAVHSLIVPAFNKASAEKKIGTREAILARTKPQLADCSEFVEHGTRMNKSKPQPMRVLMNQIFKETLATIPNSVYIGEDVRHGGYYRVTDDLASLFPAKVHDFPPDETTLIGVGMGFSQCGLVPIVEIPYAKYLDCGADMFFEAVMSHWCTNGRQKDGMVIRLQGFDKGVFGGNFHTHNSLYLPPGLDVVCYSNGRDYVRGIRHAIFQAQSAGRVVMSVDSTDLLHRRSIHGDDGLWLCPYPNSEEDNGPALLDFETVIAYTSPSNDPSKYEYVVQSGKTVLCKEKDIIIFTYGNGVPTSIQACAQLKDKKVSVVDCPTLGVVNEGMLLVLKSNPKAKLVFADVCKQGQQPFAGVILELQSRGILQNHEWSSIAASPTYNPLGSTLTFLNESDVLNSCK